MNIKNKNKSKDGKKFVCDHCGEEAEELWSILHGVHKDDYRHSGRQGQFCFEHFRLAHTDLEEFDEWYERFCPEKTEEEKEEKSKITMQRQKTEPRVEDSSTNSVDDLIAGIVAGAD